MEYFENDWNEVLKPVIQSDYFKNLMNELDKEREDYDVYPSKKDMFRAFNLTPYKDVKVVIIGQDPYYTRGVADGLAFSTKPDAKIPPSLKNIFKELEDDLGIVNTCPSLTHWAEQGVLLLNKSFSVRDGEPMSHKFLNWDRFSNFVLEKLSEHEKPIVFVLWGKQAQSLIPFIDENHTIIESAHPSPLSARRGFFGSKVFSKINQALEKYGYDKIDFTTR